MGIYYWIGKLKDLLAGKLYRGIQAMEGKRNPNIRGIQTMPYASDHIL